MYYKTPRDQLMVSIKVPKVVGTRNTVESALDLGLLTLNHTKTVDTLQSLPHPFLLYPQTIEAEVSAYIAESSIRTLHLVAFDEQVYLLIEQGSVLEIDAVLLHRTGNQMTIDLKGRSYILHSYLPVSCKRFAEPRFVNHFTRTSTLASSFNGERVKNKV